MRRVLTSLSLMSVLVACTPESTEREPGRDAFLDPVAEDPENYFLELENDSLRVVRERLAAGDEAAMHSHRARVSVFLNDARVSLAPRGGEPVENVLVAGTTRWDAPVTHSGVVHSAVENLSIELKELEGPPVPLPELDAVEVDPEHHVVDFENDRVRVVRMTYPPGSSTPPHTHRAGFGVFLSDAHGRNVPEEGDIVPIEAEARSTFWTEGGGPPHVTENLGEEDLVVLLVEMKKLPR
jgi:quercetin dioxygenase-like cupin family protein